MMPLFSVEQCQTHATLALDEFFRWYDAEAGGVFSKALVQQYRVHLASEQLSASMINLGLTAMKEVATEAVAKLAPELAARIARVRGAQAAWHEGRELLTTQ